MRSMACHLLPEYYKNNLLPFKDQASQYFNDVIQFLMKYQWVYDFPLTHYFLHKPYDLEKEWFDILESLTTEEINQIPFGYCKDSWPGSLVEFLQTAQRLTLPHQPCNLKPTPIDPEISRGMNPKKRHEVVNLSALITDVCSKNHLHNVVDVGGGLGYLGQVLSSICKHHVISLESKQCHTQGAEARNKATNTCIKAVTFELTSDVESFESFSELITHHCVQQNSESSKSKAHCATPIPQSPSSPRVCMVGLHCCGDLTPAMIRLFTSCGEVQVLICVSCCYHRMDITADSKSWPMSDILKQTLRNEQCNQWMLSTYGFRLAAQETRMRWASQTTEDHAYHTRMVGYRGILERYCQERNIDLSKDKRRLAFKKDCLDFNTYATAVINRTSLAASDHKGLLDTYAQLHTLFTTIEPFTVLQMVLQPVLESLILVDRLLYIHQHHHHVRYVSIFDDTVSPRNVAIVIEK